MDDHFTTNAQTVYLANITQGKKIIFLQKQLQNSELFQKNLEQDLETTKKTLNALIKQQSYHEVLANMNENVSRMQKRTKQLQQILKQNNAKLLIQMQLRIQQKAEYCQKVKQLEREIEQIRKTNRDKEHQFTVIVNKLRKYQDARQLTLQQKLKDNKKTLIFKPDDKDTIIRQLGEELTYYKKLHNEHKVEMDRKLCVLAYALQNNFTYANLKEQYYALMYNSQQNNQTQAILNQQIIKKQKPLNNQMLNKNDQIDSSSPLRRFQKESSFMPDIFRKSSSSVNLNESTKELIKQLKKLLLSNRLLEAALNQSLQKNKELIINNQLLAQANLQLTSQLEQYKNKGHNYLKKVSSTAQKYKIKSSQHLRQPLNLFQQDFGTNSIHRYSGNYFDDYAIKNENMDIPELIRDKKLKKYLESIKSKDYEVNIEALYRDVKTLGQFLILSLGSKSKDSQFQPIPTTQLNLQREKEKNQQKYLQQRKQKNKMRIGKSISIDVFGNAPQSVLLENKLQSKKQQKINLQLELQSQGTSKQRNSNKTYKMLDNPNPFGVRELQKKNSSISNIQNYDSAQEQNYDIIPQKYKLRSKLSKISNQAPNKNKQKERNPIDIRRMELERQKSYNRMRIMNEYDEMRIQQI